VVRDLGSNPTGTRLNKKKNQLFVKQLGYTLIASPKSQHTQAFSHGDACFERRWLLVRTSPPTHPHMSPHPQPKGKKPAVMA